MGIGHAYEYARSRGVTDAASHRVLRAILASESGMIGWRVLERVAGLGERPGTASRTLSRLLAGEGPGMGWIVRHRLIDRKAGEDWGTVGSLSPFAAHVMRVALCSPEDESETTELRVMDLERPRPRWTTEDVQRESQWGDRGPDWYYDVHERYQDESKAILADLTLDGLSRSSTPFGVILKIKPGKDASPEPFLDPATGRPVRLFAGQDPPDDRDGLRGGVGSAPIPKGTPRGLIGYRSDSLRGKKPKRKGGSSPGKAGRCPSRKSPTNGKR